MITLYHCRMARSFRPLWMLEELGLPYSLKMMPFPPRAHDKSYFAINPMGTVPALVDGEVWMSESAAMCQYLAQKKPELGLEVRADEAGYAAWLNWLHHGEATLTFPLALVLRYGRFEPEERRVPQVVEDYRLWFLARLKGIEGVLAHSDYLAANRFTAADVSVGFALLLAELLGMEGDFPPATRSYLARLKARPACQRALAVEREQSKAQGVSSAQPKFTD